MKKTIKLIGIITLAVIRHGRRCDQALAGVFAKRKLLSIITAGMLLLCMAACGGDDGNGGDPNNGKGTKTEVNLAVPTGLAINTGTKTASWTAVANANATNGYTIKIGTTEAQVTGTSHSLASLGSGTHPISVKANGYETATHKYNASAYCTAQNYIVSGSGTPTIEMVNVPGGSFQRKADNEVGSPHTVTLTGFSIGKYEVTQAQYQAVIGSLPDTYNTYSSYGVGDNYPVYYVSWYDTLVFCNKLSIAEGLSPAYRIKNSTDPTAWGSVPDFFNPDTAWDAAEMVSGSTGYRLPTEAQWEYAARGGNNSPGNFTYAGSNTASDVAWYVDNSGSTAHAVGTKVPNGLGLYDMSGNMDEWCWDWHNENFYSSSPANDPTGPASGTYRITRGGSWNLQVSYTRTASRDSANPIYQDRGTGFRVVRPANN